MTRRPDERVAEMLNEENFKELRHNVPDLSLPAVREFYKRVYQDRRLVYESPGEPAPMQTLVQVWKQLWRWR